MESNVCILVIDDDPITQDVVKTILDTMGYHTISSLNGADGLSKFSENDTISAILLDWNMPEMNGIETLDKIRHSERKDIPVIMMTAEDTSAKVKHALEHGVDDYLVKPFDEATFDRKLRGVLGGTSFRRDKTT